MSTPLASLSSSLGSRLLAGVGTLALLAAVGLFSSRPARTAGGPVPVTVANAPLAVTAADNPAKQPFQAFVPVYLPNGQNSATGPTIPVPAGKRLVIQVVSVWRSGTLAPGTMQAVTLYADSGTDLMINVFRNGTSGDEADFASVTGYLVDM